MTALDVMLLHAPQKTVTRRGLAARVGVCTRLTAVALLLLHVPGMSATARADVDVDSAVTGPVNGDGGTFTVTATGAISGGTEGVLVADSATAITTLTNAGSITGAQAVRTLSTGDIGSLVNSGTIQGTSDGIQHDGGTITSIVNQLGGLIKGDTDTGAEFNATVGTLDNAGTITGVYGVYNSDEIATFINRGTGVVGGTDTDYGFYIAGAVGTFTNEAGGLIKATNGQSVYVDRSGGVDTFTNGGLIESTNYEGVFVDSRSDGVGTFTNTGTIRSLATDGYAGLQTEGVIATLTNSGTISGYYGIRTDEEIGELTNTATGLLQGTDSGLYNGGYGAMTVINHGEIAGGNMGIHAYYPFGPLTNRSGGEISGTDVAGILIEDDARTDVATITNEAGGVITSANGAGVKTTAPSLYVRGTMANAGTIEGGTAGVDAAVGGFLSIANTGTIRYTGEGTGPAIHLGAFGILGVADGTGGPALTSTGVGALLDGTIENGGTIHYGFTIENQNVTVSAGGGTGTFTNGTLDVADGDLLFTSGVLALDADVSVDGGTGLFTNEATLALGDAQTVTGNFAQTAAGTFRSVISGTTTYGNLDVNGTAAFAGILDLSLSSFALAEGQTFNLFEFNSRTGDFSGLSVDGTSLVSAGVGLWTYDSLVLQEVWTPTSMSISVIAPVPEPSTLALGAAGLASAAWLRHRRRAAAPQA